MNSLLAEAAAKELSNKQLGRGNRQCAFGAHYRLDEWARSPWNFPFDVYSCRKNQPDENMSASSLKCFCCFWSLGFMFRSTFAMPTSSTIRNRGKAVRNSSEPAWSKANLCRGFVFFHLRLDSVKSMISWNMRCI